MKAIWRSLKEGDSVRRLAIVADLVSIIGISLATITGALLSMPAGLSPKVAIGIAVACLLFLSLGAVLLAVFVGVSAVFTEMFDEFRVFRAVLQTAVWSLFAALILLGAYFLFAMLKNSHF